MIIIIFRLHKWKSPSLQDNALHFTLINTFNRFDKLYLENKDKQEMIIGLLTELSECSEVGLGVGKTKRGLKISKNAVHRAEFE